MTLIVPVEDVARRLGIPQPLEEEDRWRIEQALLDAQADLEAYLGRPVTPHTYTESGLWPVYPGKYRLSHHPVIEIVSQVPETYPDGTPTGMWTVTYVAGLDGASDPELEPLRRWVRTHAMYSPDVQSLWRRLRPDLAQRITSISVEGQGITYGDTYAVDASASEKGLPGALPSLSTCDRWRLARRRVVQPATRVAVWPYGPAYGEWWYR